MAELFSDVLSATSAVAYLFYLWIEIRRSAIKQPDINRLASILLITAFVVHAFYSVWLFGLPTQLLFSLESVSVFISLGAIGFTLYLYTKYGYKVIAIATSPLAIVVITATMFHVDEVQPPAKDSLVIFHVFVSLLAYAALVVAAVQAVSILLLDRQLKLRGSAAFVKLMPPLETVEATGMVLLRIGVVLLTLAVLSGYWMMRQEVQLGQYWIHMGLAVACWILYSSLLAGQWLFGWRGQTSAQLSLAAFVLLMAGFLGLGVVFGYGV